jgi:hypothetical protein
MCLEIEQRCMEVSPLEVKSVSSLLNQLRKVLTDACDAKVLLNKQPEIYKHLKIIEKTKTNKDGHDEIMGGAKNIRRLKELPHFERLDGAWFDFAITLNTTDKLTEVIAFNFEIRFPNNDPLKYLRFDLNPPKHHNEDIGMRFHVHPAHRDIKFHAAPMSPLEILHLFIYGLNRRQ